MAWQSLYRRYRPQRFAEVKGQDHVVTALRNVVAEGRVAHAYLFSGPRGTGKTSTARILAKALDCEAPDQGEPDGTCASCVAITEGSSLDVHELDAASNNGVDAMRDLVSRAALGTPGRWKIYIVDEVHMLSAAASNALLKTLEEPPGHVVFVLATTDPQKVLPTIRSRTQHFEFRLLASDVLADHLRWVADDAGLDVAPAAIDLVARRGSGSARDALSALDQVAAAGAVEAEPDTLTDSVEALCERDGAQALAAVALRLGAGHDPRGLTRDLLERLREVFLATMAPDLLTLPDDDRQRAVDHARRLGPPAITRAMEVLGDGLVAMRDAPDPRVVLEVALVRLCRPEADASPAAMLERIERLERAIAGRAQPTSGAEASATSPPTPPGRPADGVRAALGAMQPPAQGPEASPPTPPAPASSERAAPMPPPQASPSPSSGLPSRDELTLAWGDRVLATLPQRAKVRFSSGRFTAVDSGTAIFALPHAAHRDRCEELRPQVEQALADHFGRPVPLRLVAETDVAPVVADPEPDEVVDLDDLRDAPAAGLTSPLDHVMRAFEGAEVVEE